MYGNCLDQIAQLSGHYADVLRCQLLTAFAALFVSSFAVAQAPQTVRVRGTIEKVDGQTLTVKLRRLHQLFVGSALSCQSSPLVQRLRGC